MKRSSVVVVLAFAVAGCGAQAVQQNPNADLGGPAPDLIGADLAGADLTPPPGSDLAGVDLAKLPGVDMAGADLSRCVDTCTSGATICDTGELRTCAMQSTGCLDYGPPQACPSGGLCRTDHCEGSCTTGDKSCAGNLLVACTSAGMWATQQVCSQTCDPVGLKCSSSTSCTPNERRCNSNQVQACNSTGTAWLGISSCLASCSAGLCTGACTPGQTRCNSGTPETCNAGGTAFVAGSACSTTCIPSLGTCADAALTIDANAAATLDGDHWYDGDVVIKNASVLNVASGRLTIHAKNVVLDATSSITVTAAGTDGRGAGTDGASKTCGYSCNFSGYIYNYNSPSTLVGGGGGGHAENGVAASVIGYNGGGGSCGTCYVNSAAGAVYAQADNDLDQGAAGGACSGTPGGKGGGLIVIDAETITIDGQITADGQSGSGCAGGGGGGGIVLRATKSLSATGTLSAQGGLGGGSGAGAGGRGPIKLYYGDAKTLTGTYKGIAFQTFLPPQDVNSSTHPRQDLWYNDGFQTFDLAWSKPFINSAGYYPKLNTTFAFVPGPSNMSIYQDVESVSYMPAALIAGTNYFHVDTLGPTSALATAEARFIVHINSTPPSVASTNHSDQNTWVDDDSPYFTWTLPQSDPNFRTFYWVFDRFKETQPTNADAAIPLDMTDPASSKRLLLPGKAPGVWFFHLVAEDTMGYLTKQAALFQVLIGPAGGPGKGSVSGRVSDGANNISGAEVSLNRGLFVTTTASDGTFSFPSSVWAQDYEIRVRKTGYSDFMSTITVASGMTTSINPVMTP
jgi:hypothetical protein